jgi:hypothetical protein
LRIASDYQFFFIVHGRQGTNDLSQIDDAFDHGSLIDASRMTEDEGNSLSYYIEHILY